MADLLATQLAAREQEAHIGRRYAGSFGGLSNGAVRGKVHAGRVSRLVAARQNLAEDPQAISA
ncbi:MAG: hypothetical protein ACKO1M_09650 [Planctomycetota bacterium]